MNDNSKNSTSKKICPFMSGDDPERVFQFCKEEECMAWGIVDSWEEYIKEHGKQETMCIYGCLLIRER